MENRESGIGAGCSFSRLREKVPKADEGLLIRLFRIPNHQSRIPAPGCSFSRPREKVPKADEGLLIRLFRIPIPHSPFPAPQ
jgi:hypothetical protein